MELKGLKYRYHSLPGRSPLLFRRLRRVAAGSTRLDGGRTSQTKENLHPRLPWKRGGRRTRRRAVRRERGGQSNAESSPSAEREVDERQKPAQEQQETRDNCATVDGSGATVAATAAHQEPSEGGLARRTDGGWWPRSHFGRFQLQPSLPHAPPSSSHASRGR